MGDTTRDPRTRQVRVPTMIRLSPDERATLDREAAKHGLSLSALLRSRALARVTETLADVRGQGDESGVGGFE